MGEYSMLDIWKERLKLEKEYRERKEELTKELTKEYHTKLRELRNQCNPHKFTFSHLGPFGNPWFYCSICRKSKAGD